MCNYTYCKLKTGISDLSPPPMRRNSSAAEFRYHFSKRMLSEYLKLRHRLKTGSEGPSPLFIGSFTLWGSNMTAYF